MSLRIALASHDDADGFLRGVQRCLRDGIAWDDVTWVIGEPDPPHSPAEPPRGSASLPADFVALIHDVVMHHADDRFMRAHRMAERVARDTRHWDDVLHPEHVHLRRMQQQVRREAHKTKAFVRFTRCGSEGDPDTRYVAWFEPEHHIVRRVAPFFARRFTNVRWALLTPLGSVEWDGRALAYGPPAERGEAPPPDAGEALWITYYERIFNPARVKVNMMKREMPVRFWPNLPEAARIPSLLAQAPARARAMQDHAADVQRRIASATPRMHAASSAPASPDDRLRALHRRVRRCGDCGHACDATQAVTGEGPVEARLMIVGEQPGDREDLEGRPFVGPAGQLLRDALREAGLDPAAIYFTNAVKHFAFAWRGKRRMHKTPGQREVEQCLHWLDEEIALVRPALIVAAGRTAAQALGRSTTAQGVPRIDLEHPAALLRSGAAPGTARHRAWVDAWRGVADAISTTAAPRA
jgi:uracil-DNA glycosylase